MKLMTRDTDYAIRALCVIAKCDKKMLSSNQLMKETKITKPFLRKILQVLNRNGIMKSHKGRGGGFVVLKDPKHISVMDIIEIFQGTIKLSEHVLKKKRCPEIKRCRLKNKLDAIEESVKRQLKLITIESLL